MEFFGVSNDEHGRAFATIILLIFLVLYCIKIIIIYLIGII